MMSVVQSVENDQYWLVELILPLFVGASHIRFEWWKKMYTSFFLNAFYSFCDSLFSAKMHREKVMYAKNWKSVDLLCFFAPPPPQS